MAQGDSVEKCEHLDRMDALQYCRNSKVGIKWSNQGWKHVYGCDICYKDLENFFGSPKTQLIVHQGLRELVKQLKDTNYELSDKEFEMLHKGSSFFAATLEEAENVREHFVLGYISLVRKLEDHLASAPS